mmetsp:Transcript_29547/g.71377  ORF Transcript_29547/g.71377 Transcript_29547/m.71377 type:complete len:183 (+) Transcript_29547:680-1228(+)
MVTTHSIKRKHLKKSHGIQQLPWSILPGDNRDAPNVSLCGSSATVNCNSSKRKVIDLTGEDDTDSSVCIEPHGKSGKKHSTALDHHMHKNRVDNTTCAAAGCAGISNLKRKTGELIYVKILNSENPAFELENPDNLGENNTVWIEWANTGEKKCIFKHQIMKNGLQARKRQRPKKFPFEYFM